MRAVLPFIAFLLLLPATVPAATYQWRDNDGVTHFTDNPDSIPPQFLGRAAEKPLSPGEKKDGMQGSAAVSTSVPSSRPVLSTSPAGVQENSWRQAEHARLAQELRIARERVAAGRTELGKLHRKWVKSMGRTPTPKEVQDFEKKRAKGPLTVEDNPYVSRIPTPKEIEDFEKKKAKGKATAADDPRITRNPLNSPGRSREAYFRKLDEVLKDEGLLAQIEDRKGALNLEADKAEVPQEWRK